MRVGLRTKVTRSVLLDAAQSFELLKDVSEEDIDRASRLLKRLDEIAIQGERHTLRLSFNLARGPHAPNQNLTNRSVSYACEVAMHMSPF